MMKVLQSRVFIIFIFCLWIISSAVVFLLWLQTNGLSARIKKSYTIPVQDAEPSENGGYAYGVPMGFDQLSQTETFASPAILLEDVIPLGPGNTIYVDIEEKGSGRFSFWKGTLYFSASDNSDPRSNGRQYRLVLPVTLSSLGMLSAFVWVVFLHCTS